MIEVNGAKATARGFGTDRVPWETRDEILALRLRGAMLEFEYSPGLGIRAIRT